MRPYRIACLVTHPIQYQAPLFRYLAADPALDLEVLFLSRISAARFYDSGFGVELSWDTPLLDGYRWKFVPTYRPDRELSFWRPWSTGLRAILSEGRFDALWLHGYAHQTMLRTIIIARSLGLKLLMRGDSIVRDNGVKRCAAKRLILPRVFKRIDGFLAVGTMNARFYRKYGVPKERIFAMPYAVDNRHFREAAIGERSKINAVRDSLGIAHESPVILFAGKLQKIKRPDDLLEAFAQLRSNEICRPPYLLFAGDGELRRSLEAQCAACGIDRVRFLGFRNQSEMSELYALCDVVVLPSEQEQWGLVLNEAMNAAKPIIVSDRVGAVPDLVSHGHNGFVYRCGDVAQLRDYLTRILGEQGLAEQMGATSLRRIQHWSFEADRRGLLQALDSLLPGVRNAPTGLNRSHPANSGEQLEASIAP